MNALALRLPSSWRLFAMPPTKEEIDKRLVEFLDRQVQAERNADSRKQAEQIAMNRVLTEVHALKAAVENRFSILEQDIKGVQARTTALEKIVIEKDKRHPVTAISRFGSEPPSPTSLAMRASMDLASERTPTGSFKASPEVWEGIKDRIDSLADELESEKSEKKIEEARRKGAEEALARSEAAAMKRNKNILFWISVAGSGGALILWCFEHVVLK